LYALLIVEFDSNIHPTRIALGEDFKQSTIAHAKFYNQLGIMGENDSSSSVKP
jgi:hypothetical protein